MSRVDVLGRYTIRLCMEEHIKQRKSENSQNLYITGAMDRFSKMRKWIESVCRNWMLLCYADGLVDDGLTKVRLCHL